MMAGLFLLGTIAFYAFLLWLAWTLVMSVKEMAGEVAKIRRELGRISSAGAGRAPVSPE